MFVDALLLTRIHARARSVPADRKCPATEIAGHHHNYFVY